MTLPMHQRYEERLNRYVTALRAGKPDRIPIRPFVAEFAAKYAGYTCQQITHDYENALAATRQCAMDFDWDATVGNMTYVWTGLTQAIGLKYYGTPGLNVPADVGFQYLEPSGGKAHMEADEYDALIADPTAFLFNTWLPRVSTEIDAIGAPATYRNNLALLKGGMAMLNYFNALGTQNERLRNECGTVSAISGILKAPLDILGDKLRGYYGLSNDLMEQPDKVLQACKALMPHLLHIALAGADPDGYVPITVWLHRGCVPFISPDHFNTIFWPTFKPIVESIWAHGNQTLFYAEGNWDAHLESFAELPDQCIIYHVDRGDIRRARKVFGNKFCLSGGVPNDLFTVGTPQEVRDCCKSIIDDVATDGAYVMDGGAIIQNDARVENVRAMTDLTREYGVYPDGKNFDVAHARESGWNQPRGNRTPARVALSTGPPPGVCRTWEDKRNEVAKILGDEKIVKQVWEANESFAHTFIWHCLVSF